MREPKSKDLSIIPADHSPAGTNILKKRRVLMDLDQIRAAIESLDYPDMVALRDHLERMVDKKHDEYVRQIREKIKNEVKQSGLSMQDIFGASVSEPVAASK